MADEVEDVVFRIKLDVEDKGTGELADKVEGAGQEFDQAQGKAKQFESRVKDAGKAADRFGADVKDAGAKTSTFRREVDQGGRSVETMSSKLKSAAGSFVAFAGIDATVRGVFQVLGNGLNSVTSFEDALAELSSITGATGGDLEFLQDQARKVGITSTIAAEDAVRAFTAIGSARPELLKNKEALAAVTKESIALAEAAKIDLADAGAAVAAAMNQFSLGAGDASRIVNALAAGSLAGAADVNELKDSISKVGTVLNANNVSFEQGVGLIETLAEKEIKGAVAGTQLRGVILKLAQSGVGFVNGQFNVNAALEQTKAKLDGIKDPAKRAEEAVKLFGLENVTAGNILLDNVDKVKQFTDAVTGTKTAYQQQLTNTSTVTGAIARLRGQFNDLFLGFTSSTGKLAKVIDFVATNLKTFIKLILIAVTAFTSWKVVTTAVAVAQSLYQKAILAATRFQLIYNTSVQAGESSMVAFSRAIRANPIGLLVTALTAVVGWLIAFNDETEQAADAQADLNKQLQETIEKERRIAETREASRNNADKVSTADIEEAIQAVRDELNGLKEDSFDVFGAISQARFQMPKLEGIEATKEELANLPEDALFVDTGKFDKATARGKKNLKLVFDAYRQFLADEIKRLQGLVDDRDKKLNAVTTGEKVPLEGTIARLQFEQQKLMKLLNEKLRVGSPDFFKVRDEYLKVTEQLKNAQDLLKEQEAFPAGSLADLNQELTFLREQLQKLPADSEEFKKVRDAANEVQAAIDKINDSLKPKATGAETQKLLQQLDEEKRHFDAIDDLDKQAAITRAKNRGASEEEIKAIEDKFKRDRLRSDLDFERKRLEILKAADGDKQAEVTASLNKIRELELELGAPPDNSEADEKRKEHFNTILDGADQIAQAGISAWQAWSDAAERSLDRQIQLQQSRVDQAKQLADKGNAAMFEAEKKRLQKLVDERRKAAERNAAIAQVEAAANAAVAIARAAAEGGGFLSAATIAATLIALGAGLIQARTLAADSIPSTGFFTGTPFVDREGRHKPGIDTVPAMLTRGERVQTVEENRRHWNLFEGVRTGDPHQLSSGLIATATRFGLRDRLATMLALSPAMSSAATPVRTTMVRDLSRGRASLDSILVKPVVHVTQQVNTSMDPKQVDRLISAIEDNAVEVEVNHDRDGFALSMQRVLKRRRALNRRL